MYQADTDGRMPLQGWTEAIGGYVGSREVYQCPMLAGPYGYAMSEEVVGLDVNTVDAHRSIAAFDGPGGKDSIGGAIDIQFRHDDKYAYVNFLDGHSRGYERKDIPPILQPIRR
jgi:prepilin-type processing-associated H-X9-DG protein